MKKTRFILAALVALVASVFVTSCTQDEETSYAKAYVKPHEVEIDSTKTGVWSTELMSQSVDEKFQNYSGTYVTTKTTTADGEVTDEVSDSVEVNFKFPHSLVAKSNWTAEQEQPTATASKAGASSAEAKDTSFVIGDEFVVKATKITEKWQATVRLADGTSRTDVWEKTYFTGVSVSRGQDVLQYANFPTGATNTAATKKTGDNAYAYGDTLSYTLGENVSKATAPGTITIKVNEPEPEPDTFFPKEWGKLLEVRQLHSLNENGTAGVDTWCMYFQNDKVLPVVLPNGTPDYNFKLVETTTEKSYNGAGYNTSLANPRWQPVYGVKEASCITYTRTGGKVIEKVGYLQASRLPGGWNLEDGGNFDCKIDRYSFTIKDGVFTAYKKGTKLGSWTYYNK